MPARAHFTTITIEGALLPSDLISRLVNDPRGLTGTRDEDYRLTPGTHLREIINRSWNDLLGAWQVVKTHLDRLDTDDHSATLTRDRWLLPLFAELGYGRLERADTIAIGDKDYPVSHHHEQALVHLVGWNVSLDKRTSGVTGAAKAAPHSMVQELLNRSGDQMWGILSNGRFLRILRDNASFTRVAYVEFDLETMFGEGVFSDFVALWLLAHATRVEGDPQSTCWLEQWATEARQQGVRALETLGEGFQHALETLGQGFLAHAANADLRQRLRDGEFARQDYYRQLLRIVYRLVFLLVAEDRDLLHPPDATDAARLRYARYYSLTRIRELARRRRGTAHSDLWEQIVLVARSLGRAAGLPDLGLPALGSALWASEATADLDGARIANTVVLTAIRSLAYTQREHALHRIDYQNLGSEELGSIYESLLELKPDLDPASASFRLRRTSGNERKTTGSYYTPTSLISALLDVSLDRLLDEAEGSEAPETAILDLRIIDPACGSGHFLVAAAQRMARRLAALRTGESDPTPEAARHALRDIVAHCIYGVDINPMAVELCKVSLWLEAVEPGRPLSFLDHHVVNGNALIGVTPRLLEAGVPDTAFTAIEGDDKPTATARRRANAVERTRPHEATLAFSWDASNLTAAVAAEMAVIESLPGNTPQQVDEQASRYYALRDSADATRARMAADAWCAAFVAVKTKEHPTITDGTVRLIMDTPSAVEPAVLNEIASLAEKYQFLHWHLAFPQVYSIDAVNGGSTGCSGGFDLLVGNPPWDTLSPDAKEFFAALQPEIRFMKKADQDAVIHQLSTDPTVASEWQQHRRDLFAIVHFLRHSGRYRLFAPGNLGKGDFNIYRMFVEAALTMTKPAGWAAQITPSGLYNGANAAAIRKELFDHCRLDLLAGLINRGAHWFPGIHADAGFAMYAAQRGGVTDSFSAAFQITDESSLANLLSSPLRISVETVRSQSSDALAVSETRGGPDVDIVAKIYGAWPAFGEVVPGFPHRVYQAEIHMGTDRDLFGDSQPALPLYEGRMIDQFDHRAKAYRTGRGRAAVWEPLEFGDPRKAIVPQWRVPRMNIPDKVGGRVDRYRVAFCDVTGPRNERSLIAALVPPGVICGHSAPTFTYERDAEWGYLTFLAVANSFSADFLIRKRVTLHVSLSVLDALPIPRLPVTDPILKRLAPLVLRLSCTSPEMTGYWNAMAERGWCHPVAPGSTPSDALIDAKQRAHARAEIDAIIAKHIYRLTADELAYILDQFPGLEGRDRKTYGFYATKDRVLACFLDA